MPPSCKILLPALLFALTLPPLNAALACGPWFPPSTLGGGDKALLAAPVADFAHEIRRLLPKAVQAGAAAASDEVPEPEAQTDAADVADVLAATHNANLAHDLAAWRKKLRAPSTKEKPAPSPGNPPPNLPPEFLLYETGALFYHQGDLAAARAQWQKLLDLPEIDRQHRTLWAAYMIARSYVESDPVQAAKMFDQFRNRAKPVGPFADPLGFAAASMGWQAKALNNEPFQTVPALKLYFEQAAVDGRDAVWSLRDTAAELLGADEETLKQAAQDPIARQILTIYLISNGGPFTSSAHTDREKKAQTWLRILESSSLKNIAGADRLAWMAYKSNQMKLAQRWLNLSQKNGEASAVAQWIQAKLLLRNGDVEKAAACLAKAAKAFPQDENWAGNIEDGEDDWRPAAHATGELAALKLGRGNYTESLDLLFRSAWWWDAAYVAERVLTVDELKTYVDKNWPAGAKAKPVAAPRQPEIDDQAPYSQNPDPAELRNLLARRLARLGRLKEARLYFDPETQTIFDAYVDYLDKGRDKSRPAVERGRSLFAAARIAREHGMEILATEWGPDAALVGGCFELGSGAESMVAERNQNNERLAISLSDELQRVTDSSPSRNVRFQYRYLAADLAWEAARLLPDNSAELANVYCEAGSWLKRRDPKAADRFYKALVKRCPDTPQGKQAALTHWFPVAVSSATPATSPAPSQTSEKIHAPIN